MRILMVSDVYFPRINGVSTSIQTFWREFAARGHEVTLVAPDYGSGADDPPGLLRVPSRRLPMDPEDRMLETRRLRALVPQLAREDFDLVHIQTPFVAHFWGVRLAQRLGLPRVESYHTYFEEYLYQYVRSAPRGLMRLAARKFSKWQCNNVDALVVPSSAMAEELRGYGVRRPMEIIPTGIELDEFQGGVGARFRARHHIPPERPVLVHVGRVAREKSIDFLLRMVARLRAYRPDVLLVIAGEGPAQRGLQREVHALGIEDNVRFVGYLSRAGELQDCYAAGDLFVFASRTETQGLVLLEAMALGVPVVSLSEMGTRDILAAGRGALVAPAEEEAFAGQVLRLLRAPALRERLAREAREYARTWSAGALAERMLAFYDRTLESHRGVEQGDYCPQSALGGVAIPCGEEKS